MNGLTWLIRCLLVLALMSFLVGAARIDTPTTATRINWIALGLALVTMTLLIMR